MYRGAAMYYDRFRLAYPGALIDDLAERAQLSGTGTLLDLACGTGQIALAMHRYFSEVWAVDQEAGMVKVAEQKARAARLATIRFMTCAAEDLMAPDGLFDLVAIGNAFHRLPRQVIAGRTFRWTRPGKFLALLWGGSPWEGEEPWQQALSAIMERWKTKAATRDRVPAGYEQDRREFPDLAILRAAGFEHVGSYDFTIAHDWTPATIAGFALSTSVLSPSALGGNVAAFRRDLRREMQAAERTGRLRQDIQFAYVLARRPKQ